MMHGPMHGPTHGRVVSPLWSHTPRNTAPASISIAPGRKPHNRMIVPIALADRPHVT
jgi:hypothetical protein